MLNRVELIGTLGKDPEVKQTTGGNTVANLSIATTETYKDKQGKKVENTSWHTVQLWGKTAEIAEKYLVKGSRVFIEAKLNYRNYENKDGNKVYVTEIIGNRLIMLSTNKKSESGKAQAHDEKEAYMSDALDQTDDLPF